MRQKIILSWNGNVGEWRNNEGGPPQPEAIPPSHVAPVRRYPVQLNFLDRGNSTEFLFALLIPAFVPFLSPNVIARFIPFIRWFDLGSRFYRLIAMSLHHWLSRNTNVFES